MNAALPNPNVQYCNMAFDSTVSQETAPRHGMSNLFYPVAS